MATTRAVREHITGNLKFTPHADVTEASAEDCKGRLTSVLEQRSEIANSALEQCSEIADYDAKDTARRRARSELHKAALVLLFATPGVPMVLYGSEFANPWRYPFTHYPVPSPLASHEEEPLLKELLRLRWSFAAFAGMPVRGPTTSFKLAEGVFNDSHVLVMLRQQEAEFAGNRGVLVVVNSSAHHFDQGFGHGITAPLVPADGWDWRLVLCTQPGVKLLWRPGPKQTHTLSPLKAHAACILVYACSTLK